MRLLVLGGTWFAGRAVVEEAIRRGHDVTTFTRGLSGDPLPGAEALHGDRTSGADLRQLATGREWDAVVDTSVLAPAHVAASARLLADRVGHYTYISTINVYRDWPAAPVTEESATFDCAPDATGTTETLGYGPLKAGSERAIAAALPDRNLLIRAGLLAGPHDNTGRLPWWLARLAAGGKVLAPGDPGRPFRVTDVRDLASWVLDNTRRRIPGAVNVPGPEHITLGELLTACADATRARPGGTTDGPPAELAWASDAELLAAGVTPWAELPFWAPDTPRLAGIWQMSGDRALQTGIRYRPLADTVRDTWRWLRQSATGTGSLDTAFTRLPGTGLDPAREREILAGLPGLA
jgi:nucleoside-diphosphate-sugar epimerase